MRACLVIVAVGALLHLVLSLSTRDQQTYGCWVARNGLAMIEQNYHRKYHRWVTGDEAALNDLVLSGVTRQLPVCRAGGHYSAVANPDGSITIHCSVPGHDQGEGVTRKPFVSQRPHHH